MPAGNPAGYLPSIKKRLKNKGVKTYKPRAKQKPVATIKVPKTTRPTRLVPPNEVKGAPQPKFPAKKAPKPIDFASPGMAVSNAQRKARTKPLSASLTFKEKYLRRSTDSSRARFAKKAGRKVGAKLKRQAEGSKARYFGRSK